MERADLCETNNDRLVMFAMKVDVRSLMEKELKTDLSHRIADTYLEVPTP